jgi:hypothetical protein
MGNKTRKQEIDEAISILQDSMKKALEGNISREKIEESLSKLDEIKNLANDFIKKANDESQENLYNIELCTDLQSCLKWFFDVFKDDPNLTDWLKIKNAEDAVAEVHHTMGMWLRNTLHLWHNGVMADYFISLGIYHADDMSSIILYSAHRSFNKKPINVEKQIKKYRDYWDKTDPKVNEGFYKE